jgi:nicotinamidase-related amidase
MDNIIDVLTSEDHATAINEMKDDMTDAHIKVVMPTVWESPPEANKGPTLVETPLEAHKGPPVRETPQEVHSMDNSSSKWLSVSVLTMATHIASFLGQLQ